jgi:hypothetical protein
MIALFRCDAIVLRHDRRVAVVLGLQLRAAPRRPQIPPAVTPAERVQVHMVRGEHADDALGGRPLLAQGLRLCHGQ